MVEASEQSARRAAILEASIGVFLRYGFKKTSMDDVARAAGISRQGLYLHFPTKEALFKEAVQDVIARARAASRAALASDADLSERLAAAFEAVHAIALERPGAENMNELLESAAQLVGPALAELEEGLVADVTRALRAGGVAARWKEAGLSAKDLAEHLHAASYGVKHTVKTRAAYRERLRHAVRIVCEGRASET